MRLSRSLLRWYFRAAWLVTLPASLLAAGFALFYPELLHTAVLLSGLFIFVHSILVARALGRLDTPATAYLYTRGFSRDRLWAHRLVAHLLCVLAVWGPAALVVWLGVRAALQDHWMRNPYYPLMRSSDYAVPLVWLVGYLLLAGVVEYAMVRRAQPTCDRDAGHAITVGVFFTALMLDAMLGMYTAWYFLGVPAAAILIASAALLLGGWRLHRQVEVRP